ncbi:SPOR domain-containing protein [Bacteroidales bacterium OttesenSCG-928-J19]|nr:SPOR domain-containing protein [Bacteroidales bacterium OttesenSCG-928-J19]
MRLKNVILPGLLTLALVFTSCKSKQESYQASYEAAKSKPTVYVIEEVNPVTKPKASNVTAPQKEKLTTVSGPAINTYSVVIGSFVNKTNAISLKERMEKQGYTPTLAQNEKGMYRVILSTFDDYSGAEGYKTRIINKFAPDFSDAWVLEQIK